jgi:hypothetical protein
MLGLFDTAQHGWASIADVGRRIELSARGERFTTILHEIVRLGRTVALERVLDRGVDPLSSTRTGQRRCIVSTAGPTTSTPRSSLH